MSKHIHLDMVVKAIDVAVREGLIPSIDDNPHKYLTDHKAAWGELLSEAIEAGEQVKASKGDTTSSDIPEEVQREIDKEFEK